MENIRLLFAGVDDDFRMRFINYMINDCRNVSIFNMNSEKFRSEAGARRIDSARFDVVAVDEELMEESCLPGKNMCMIVFTSEECGTQEKNEGYHKIWRYQSASVILSEILRACGEDGVSIKRSRSNGSFSIVTVTSASGGAGKTSLCLSFARIRRQYTRHNPLVIDMKSMSDHNRYFPKKEYAERVGISELLVDPERCAESPEKYITRDNYGVAGFVMSDEVRSDISSLDREGIACLLKMIENWGLFDMIVIEMDSRLDEASAYLYGESDCIFSLTDERRNRDEDKADRWDDMISRYSGNDKIIRINNFSGADRPEEITVQEDDEDQDTGKVVNFRIPYDPDSFYRSDDHEEISLLGSYGASVSKIVKEAVKY